MIGDLAAKAAHAWNHFWFEFDHPLGLALTRIQLGLVLFWLTLMRQIYSLSWYAADGMVPREMALPLMPETMRSPFPWFMLWPDSLNAAVHGVLLVLTVLIVLGAWTRWISIIAWILQMGFIQRNYAVVFGADVIAAVFLFYLSFTRADERLSLRAWRCRRPRTGSDAVSSAFARLLQIQLALIYAYTGLEKLRGQSWWDGTALWTVFGNPQMVVMDLSWLRHLPLVIAGLTFATVIFEIYWPFAILAPRVRKWWLAAGALFHCGIGLFMGLWTFSLIMLAPYWIFLKPAEVERISVSVRDVLARVFPFSRRSV